MCADTSSKDGALELTLDKFWETIPPLWGYVRAHIRAAATEGFEVSVEQFHILRYIRRGYVSVSDLAEARSISRPAVSQGVDALVNKGLVSRTQSETDRRYVSLALTPAGSALLDSVFHETREWMKTLLEDFSPAELVQAAEGLEILKKIIAND